MEKDLHDRDVVGLQDFLLLENYQNEDAFLDNLKKRFDVDLIYTYIGQVLISVNPYKELNIYNESDIKLYQGKHFFENSPHVFAISENSYRSLIEENIGQCILISGESGSGKTEASKKVLQYIAAASDHEATVETVKDKLLQSNPVLEAFGNAKTNRNDNSSRFGKYMDIQFNYTGHPVGGNILNYLLEKSRVIHQNPGERNFHIFYQLLAGADDGLLRDLHLTRELKAYNYLSCGAQTTTINDSANYKMVQSALKTIEMSAEDNKLIHGILAGILHLGNVNFGEEDEKSKILNNDVLQKISSLMLCDQHLLANALTHRTIDARGDVVVSDMNKDLAAYARDALAKAIYDRLFTWLVQRINKSLHIKSSDRYNVIGILDIYGFEIFGKNSFEQFCINFCNEKLQQLFIELTLKSEQEEYLREGIEWISVEYFDNKVICDLVEEKHKGIISLMDEECLRPGEPTDMSFLNKMTMHLAKHKHYVSHSTASLAVQKVMGRDEFRLVHYAGEVTYSIDGMLDKNNDLLFRDLKEAMSKSKNEILRSCFPEAEYLSKKMPNTAITKFKNSLNELIQILMSKEPSYIRCIKPNEIQAAKSFDVELVRHQVKYLGLMENLRVRRAGFAYRRKYEMFLNRYKCLSKETWPHYNGSPKDGVQILANTLNYKADDYKMGITKIFIRHPATLFATEDAFQRKKHELVSKIKALWRGRKQRKIYLEMRAQVIIVQSFLRRYLAIQAFKRRRHAANVLRDFIKGFITRNNPPNGLNDSFIAHSKKLWLLRLSKSLPQKILDHSWPNCPAHCTIASIDLRRLHKLYLVKAYKKNLSPEKKRQFELKVLSEQTFKGKKRTYPKSIGPPFLSDRTNTMHKTPINEFVKASFGAEKLKYATSVVKYDRHGYKPRERIFLLSEKAVYILDAKNCKQKHRLPLEKIEFCVTNEMDSIFLIRIPPELKEDKGDLILEMPELIEACIWILDVTKNKNIVKIIDTGSINHNLVKGKSGMIEFQPGQQANISRAKSGNLLVIVGQ